MDVDANAVAKGPWLTVDQGNSATKFVLWQRDGAGVVVAATRGHFDSTLESPALLKSIGGFAPVAISFSSVANDSARQALLDRCLGWFGEQCHLLRPDCGLELAVQHAETLGADRRFAARGAVELAGERAMGRPLIVVDAGTALTVDAVVGGVFLGGAIAPGPGLLARALEAGGANLMHVDPEPGAPALGRHTQGALRAGVAVGFRGAARELVRDQLEDEAVRCDAEALVFLTGGAREFLLTPTAFVELELIVDGDLVHRGLLAALRSELDIPKDTPRPLRP